MRLLQICSTEANWVRQRESKPANEAAVDGFSKGEPGPEESEPANEAAEAKLKQGELAGQRCAWCRAESTDGDS